MLNEEFEQLFRCVVCCGEIRRMDSPPRVPEYCHEHGGGDDPSFPPIPFMEWWPDWEEDRRGEYRFETGDHSVQ